MAILDEFGRPFPDHSLSANQAPNQTPTSVGAQNPSGWQTQQPAPPMSTGALNSPPQTDTQRGQAQEEKNYRLQKINTTVNGLLCFFTACAFGAALWYASIANEQKLATDMQTGTLLHQVHISEQANYLAKESSITSETQSKDALAETRRSNAISRESLISVQRAFVVYGTAMQYNAITFDGKKITDWEFRPTIENTGTTPTRDIVQHSNSLFWSELPDDFKFFDIDTSPPTHFVLGPKGQATGARSVIPISILRGAWNVPNSHIYFWGWSTYRDVFAGTKPHVTMFCIRIDEIRSDPDQAPLVVVWSLHKTHNCHDEECKGQPGNPLEGTNLPPPKRTTTAK